MLARVLVIAGAVLLAAVLAPAAEPQEANGAHNNTRGLFGGLINVDALIDNYIHFLARKYDLNQDQDEFTQVLVHTRVDEFLGRHREELVGLVERLFEVRSGGEMTTAELIEWGRQAQPIYDEARQIIVEANDEWRQILTEEQKRLHDDDVRLMYQSFATTEDQLNRLVSGQMTVEEFRNPNRVQATRVVPSPRTLATPAAPAGGKGEPANPAKLGDVANVVRKTQPTVSPRPTVTRPVSPATARTPAGGASTARPGGRRTVAAPRGSTNNYESTWDQYVNQFIQRYQLNDEQQAQAQKILRSCKQQAERYMHRSADASARLDKEAADLAKSESPNKAQLLQRIAEKRSRLMAPVDRIFEKQLKPRLERIPTRAQREAAEKGGNVGQSAIPRPAAPVPATPVPPAKPEAPPAPDYPGVEPGDEGGQDGYPEQGGESYDPNKPD